MKNTLTDLNNYLFETLERLTDDSLNGLAYPDDSAVQIDRCWKVYTNAAPRVEVAIRPATPEG